MAQGIGEAIGGAVDWLPAPVALALGIAGLLAGGKWLVDGAVTLSRRLGVSALVVGLTVVAFGTSTPELAFNITAAVRGNSELSFGNVIGSNVANIGLVLGVAAVIGPMVIHSRVVRLELPQLMIVSGLLVALALTPPSVRWATGTEIGFGRVDGVIMLLGFVAICAWWWWLSKRDADDPLTTGLAEAGAEAGSYGVAAAIGLCAVGVVLLAAGGQLSEAGAVRTARWFGVSETMIGLTIIAVATSLPEVVTCIIAVRRNQTDIAIGNVVGSNLFNILLVLGATAAIAPVAVPGGRGPVDMVAMLLFTLLLWAIACTPNRSLRRPHGVVLLALYLGYHVITTVIYET